MPQFNTKGIFTAAEKDAIARRARQLGVRPGEVAERLIKYRIAQMKLHTPKPTDHYLSTRPVALGPKAQERVRFLHSFGWSQKNIAREFNVGPATIRKVLAQEGCYDPKDAGRYYYDTP